ncbi:MAG TPA: MotA/TolQ/ExbB proton channel family protein [Steroidobacteraceae bacterium]|nr:MotA/TolQ/ExbB proton channel family protein [Steroidobacteraceae bacterium]
MIDASAFPAVELTLWLLALFSVATWALIAIKVVQHFRVRSRNTRFAKAFGASANLQVAADLKDTDSPLSRLAGTGFGVLRSAPTGQDVDLEHSWDRRDLLERNLRQQIQKEKRGLESGLAVLATVGSTAPFVGLFGTVWGIMTAMKDISRIGNASIDVVAGPIGEALIATGIGIAVAIPAVLAYNYFLRRLKSVNGDLDDFAHDFINLAQRAGYRVDRGIRAVENRQRESTEFDRSARVGEYA